MIAPRVTVDRIHTRTTREQMDQTVRLVGEAVRAGSTYFPLRQHAAEVAATAPPKDFPAQLRALYADFVRRWRYVRDPRLAEYVAHGPRALWEIIWGGGKRRGVGDCDDATAAFGAAASAIGFNVRLVTSVPLRHARDPRLCNIPGHIYPEVWIDRLGWVPADPVVWPAHGFGYAAPALRRFRFDLWGRPIGARSPLSCAGAQEEKEAMLGTTDDRSWDDHGLVEHGYALGYMGDDIAAPPLDWSVYGLAGFGAGADRVHDTSRSGMLVEVDPDEYGLARTPMIEMAPDDVAHVQQYGRPYDGMLALGDDGNVYQWQPAAGFALGGFFSKMFHKIRKGIHKLAHLGLKFARKLISKLPGGKYLVKFVDKIHKVAMKLVRPLMKFVGKWAKKLAPIAAMIPGYGPVIAVALRASGRVASLMQKFDVHQTKKGAIIPHSKKSLDAFHTALKAEAEKTREKLRAARAAGKLDPRHLPKGTPEHVAALHALGIKPLRLRTVKPTRKATAAPVAFAW